MSLLDTTKEYLKIDGTARDTEIGRLIIAAKTYLTNAGVSADDGNELYCLAVGMLVTHWFDNRGAITVGTIKKTLEFSLSSILMQLRLLDDDE